MRGRDLAPATPRQPRHDVKVNHRCRKSRRTDRAPLALAWIKDRPGEFTGPGVGFGAVPWGRGPAWVTAPAQVRIEAVARLVIGHGALYRPSRVRSVQGDRSPTCSGRDPGGGWCNQGP